LVVIVYVQHVKLRYGQVTVYEYSRELAQLGVRRKINFSSSQKKSLNVAADVVENIKKPAGHWRDKAKGLEEIK